MRRRPLRRGRRFIPRRFQERAKLDFYLNLIKDIESMVKGNEFTAEDYMEFYNDREIDVTVADIDKYLTQNIDNKNISNLKYEETEGVLTYTKTELPFGLVYDKIDSLQSRDRNRPYTIAEIFSEDFYSITMKKQLKEAFEIVIKDSGLVEKQIEKDGTEVYVFKTQPNIEPDLTVLSAVSKIADMKPGSEFTLSELLGETPTDSQIKTLNFLIEERVFDNVENDTNVKCKDLNSSKEMVYIKAKNEY